MYLAKPNRNNQIHICTGLFSFDLIFSLLSDACFRVFMLGPVAGLLVTDKLYLRLFIRPNYYFFTYPHETL